MNKISISAAAAAIIVVLMINCGRENPTGPYRTITNTYTTTPTITLTPTITMTPALFVQLSSGGMITTEYPILFIWTPINATGFLVRLRNNDGFGRPINNAEIDFDGNTLTEDGSTGNYLYYTLSHTYSPGDAVHMNITTGTGSTTASITMPQKAEITSLNNNDSLDPGIDNTVYWIYPGPQPAEVNVGATGSITGEDIYFDVTLPGNTTQYTIPAGTLPAGKGELFIGVGGISYTTLTNVEAGSNSFSVRNADVVVVNTK